MAYISKEKTGEIEQLATRVAYTIYTKLRDRSSGKYVNKIILSADEINSYLGAEDTNNFDLFYKRYIDTIRRNSYNYNFNFISEIINNGYSEFYTIVVTAFTKQRFRYEYIDELERFKDEYMTKRLRLEVKGADTEALDSLALKQLIAINQKYEGIRNKRVINNELGLATDGRHLIVTKKKTKKKTEI